MPISIDTAISVQERSNTQEYKITRIVSNITSEGIDNPEEEITGILEDVKSDHLKEGRTNGHITVIIPVEDYRTIISNITWVYNQPVGISA